MSWRRHIGDSKWHTGDEAGGCFCTQCNGRWSLLDELQNEVEHDANPPHDERCDVCQRVHIDVIRVELGLHELTVAVHDRFDLGGEA